MSRRSPEQIAAAARARVETERARLELDRIKAVRKVVKTQLATYRAAEIDRMNRDWFARATSADSAILSDLPRLNARARQLVRDNAYAASIVRSFRRNVVGTGINPAFAAGEVVGRFEEYNRAADVAWHDWSTTPALVDRERRRTFTDVQRWAIGEVIEVGEAFVIRSAEGPKGRQRLVLQCVESEQLDRYKLEHNGNEVRSGVEVDSYGAAIAYWFYHRHPHDMRGLNRPAPLMLDSFRVPANRVCHIYDPTRVRQTRGVTRLAPVMARLHALERYDKATLDRACAEANIGLIFKTEGGITNQVNFDGLNALDIGPNDEVASHVPTAPGNLYNPFVVAQLRAIAAGVGISYEQIARDFHQGTYSSQRQGMLEDRREWEPDQEMLIRKLCQPVLEDFVWFEVWSGRLDAPLYSLNPDLYDYAEWRGQGWAWVDPEKQANGIKTLREIGLSTLQMEAMEIGRDWRELVDQRRKEIAYGAPYPSSDPDGQGSGRTTTPEQDETAGRPGDVEEIEA